MNNGHGYFNKRACVLTRSIPATCIAITERCFHQVSLRTQGSNVIFTILNNFSFLIFQHSRMPLKCIHGNVPIPFLFRLTEEEFSSGFIQSLEKNKIKM